MDYVYNSTHSSSRNSRGAIKTKDKSFAHTCYALGGEEVGNGLLCRVAVDISRNASGQFDLCKDL